MPQIEIQVQILFQVHRFNKIYLIRLEFIHNLLKYLEILRNLIKFDKIINSIL
jgi:hypothetical protein